MTGHSLYFPAPSSGLGPVTGKDPFVLILGSFPSILSLEKQEYYGNPKNRFWAVMEELFSVPAGLPYPDRIALLTGNDVALWDVIRACERAGSADSRIRNPLPNDIGGFARAHPTLRLVALNGGTAWHYYERFNEIPGVPTVVLPSTSPANARLPFAEKVRRWEAIKIRDPDDQE
jgi:TDG/mug DNA glycosylase family protein